MSQAPICDYSGFDYKKEFWVKANRALEARAENYAVQKMLKLALKGQKSFKMSDFCCRLGKSERQPAVYAVVNEELPRAFNDACGKNRHFATIMDAGCGFGRLFPAYEKFGQNFILFDYAQNLLDEAKKTLGNKSNVSFIQGNLYQIPINDNSVDFALSIRVLHHLVEPEKYFAEMQRIIKPGGYLLFEIPNKRHILNIFRYWLGKLKVNPFSQEVYYLKPTFVNFHPDHLKQLLKDNGFEICATSNTSFFRHNIFKYLMPLNFLYYLEIFCQNTMSWLNLTPSIYVLGKKKGALSRSMS